MRSGVTIGNLWLGKKGGARARGDTPGEDGVRSIVVREGAKQQRTERSPKARVRRIAVAIGKTPASVIERRHVLRKETVSPCQRNCV